MDIDISDFSKKAKGRLYAQVIMGPYIIATVLSFVFICSPLLILTSYLFNDYLGIFNPSDALALLNILITIGAIALISKYLVKRRLVKLSAMEYLPMCYECKTRRLEGETTCPKCGFNLRIKQIELPKKTFYGLCYERLLPVFITLLIVFPITRLMDAWKYRNSSLAITIGDNGTMFKMRTDFPLGRQIIYNNTKAKIAAVGLDERYNTIYTIDVNGQKVYGVAASELQKVSIPEN